MKNTISSTNFKVFIPEEQSGKWKIKKFVVTKNDEEFQQLRATINPHRESRIVPAGEYTGLYCGFDIIMSDTPDEINDHYEPIFNSNGNVLITGLGLGIVLNAVAKRKEVTHVTVIEKSEDVIKLVWEHYKKIFGNKIEIIHGDAFLYTPSKNTKYDYVWHDIWDNICSDNLDEMKKLRIKYSKFSKKQEFWAIDLCRRNK